MQCSRPFKWTKILSGISRHRPFRVKYMDDGQVLFYCKRNAHDIDGPWPDFNCVRDKSIPLTVDNKQLGEELLDQMTVPYVIPGLTTVKINGTVKVVEHRHTGRLHYCWKKKTEKETKSIWVCLQCTRFLLKLAKLVILRAEFSYFNFPPRAHKCNLVKSGPWSWIYWAMLVFVLRYFLINSSTRARTHNSIFL